MSTTTRTLTKKRTARPWEAQKNKLLRSGVISRWKLGYSEQPAQTETIQAEDAEHDEDVGIIERNEDRSNEEDAMMIRFLFERARLLYSKRIGGLRTEPFDALPIPSKGEVPFTFDFLAQHWVHIDMSDMQRGSDGRPLLYSTYFASLLNDPMVFEVMMAFCMLIQSLHRGALPALSREALFHASNCMAIVRNRLQMPGEESRSDMVICTIVVLGAIAAMTRDYKSLEFHVNGMQKIVALRGGYDKLGWDGYVATRCRQIEAGWLSVQKQKERADFDRLIYPSHPFSPELCARLSQIPTGLSDLALKGKLSLQFIAMIEDVLEWDRNIGTEATDKSPGTEVGLFLNIAGATQLEAFLAMTFLTYIAFEERKFSRSNPALEGALERYSQDFINDDNIWDLKTQDVFVWAVSMLVVISDPKSELYRWARGILEEIKPTDQKKAELEKAFFAIPAS